MEEFRARWIIAIDSMLPITYFYGCIEAKSMSFLLISATQFIDRCSTYGGKAIEWLTSEQIENNIRPHTKWSLLASYPKNEAVANAMFAIIFETGEKREAFMKSFMV